MHMLWADTMSNLEGIGGGKKVVLMERQKQVQEEGEVLED